MGQTFHLFSEIARHDTTFCTTGLHAGCPNEMRVGVENEGWCNVIVFGRSMCGLLSINKEIKAMSTILFKVKLPMQYIMQYFYQ